MTPELASAIASELATVLGALLDTPMVSSKVDQRLTGRHWAATVVAEHEAQGAAILCFDELGAAAVTGLVMGLDEAAPEASIADTLRETLTQALSTTSFKDAINGVLLRVTDLALRADAVEGESYLLEAAGLSVPLTLAIGGALDLDAQIPAAGASGAAEGAVGDSPADRIDVILDIDLPLIVRFGRTELPLRTLARMGPGSLIDLGRAADDPVDVLVSNRVVARGEVVIVGGNYGVRIIDVVSPKERIRSMEA